MATIMEGQDRVVIFIEPKYHEKLMQRSLSRGAELGRRVSMGFVVQEMLDREEALETGEVATELFRSHD